MTQPWGVWTMGQKRRKCVCFDCWVSHVLRFVNRYCTRCGGPRTPGAALCSDCSIAIRRINRSTTLTSRQQQIWNFWNSIPNADRRVSRIAAMLGVNPGTVRVHYNRACERMARRKDAGMTSVSWPVSMHGNDGQKIKASRGETGGEGS